MDTFQCSFHLILSLNSYCKFHLLQKKSSELLYFALFVGQYLSCNWFIKDTELIQASYYKKSATYCEDFQCLSFSVFVLVIWAVLPILCWVGSSCKRRWSSSHYMQVGSSCVIGCFGAAHITFMRRCIEKSNSELNAFNWWWWGCTWCL